MSASLSKILSVLFEISAAFEATFDSISWMASKTEIQKHLLRFLSVFLYHKQKRLEKQFWLESVTEWILSHKKKLLMCHASYSK